MVSCSTVFSAGTPLHTTANCTVKTCPIANITGRGTQTKYCRCTSSVTAWVRMADNTTEKGQGCSDNGVHVLDIRGLSKEEWNNQSFCVMVLHVKEPTVSDPEFWPEDIGYRRFFKKKINQQNNERNNTT